MTEPARHERIRQCLRLVRENEKSFWEAAAEAELDSGEIDILIDLLEMSLGVRGKPEGTTLDTSDMTKLLQTLRVEDLKRHHVMSKLIDVMERQRQSFNNIVTGLDKLITVLMRKERLSREEKHGRLIAHISGLDGEALELRDGMPRRDPSVIPPECDETRSP